jgi:hypothetical protein
MYFVVHQFHRHENADFFVLSQGLLVVIFALDTTVSMSTTPEMKLWQQQQLAFSLQKM